MRAPVPIRCDTIEIHMISHDGRSYTRQGRVDGTLAACDIMAIGTDVISMHASLHRLTQPCGLPGVDLGR